MREEESNLPEDVRTLVNEIDEAYRSGPVSEVFQRGVLSDICHDEVLIQCSQAVSPAADHTVNALVFLSTFDTVRKKLAAFYASCSDSPAFESKAVHFRNMTPYSIVNRTRCRVTEVAGDESNRGDLIQYEEFINGVAQEANQIFQKSLEAKARR
ncbi:MAG: hypothetical protein WD992_01360 [Candidatus Levyibacteriota bacterium]